MLGVALWAFRRVLEHDGSFAFPAYYDSNICKANSSSAALNKWVKKALGDGYVAHGFRHSLYARLRAVECQSDVADAIGD